MASEIKIENNSSFNEATESLGITSFKQAANAGSSFVFVCNKFFPFYFDYKTNDFMLFHGKPKSKPATTCIDISDNKKYVVTGHQDGSISLWSIPDNFSFIKQFQKLHVGSPITHVKFGRSCDVIYVADANGIITHVSLTVIIAAYAFKETVVYERNTSSLKSIVLSRQGDPFPIGFLVFEDCYITFDPSAIPSTAFSQNKKIIIYQSEKLRHPPHLTLFARQQDYFLNIAVGSSLKMLQIRDIKTTIPLLSDVSFPGEEIRDSIYLSSSLIVVLTDDGTLQLMLYNGDIICKHQNDQLAEILNSSNTLLCYNEKIVSVTNNTARFIAFANWEDMIEGMARDGQWSNAFQSLAEINLNLSCNLIGIPSNLSIRRRRVLELGKRLIIEFFTKALKEDEESLVDKVATATINIVTLELTTYMISDIYEVFKIQNKLKYYFEGIRKAGDKNFVQFCTSKFIDNFFDYADEEHIKGEYEDYLITLKYSLSQVAPLVEIASERDLLKLIKYLYINYLGDCITPAQFYFEADRISEYVDFIFNDNSDDEKSRARQRTMIVWLLIPDSRSQFKRFYSLYQHGWEKALYYVTLFLQFLTESPIQFSFTDFMKVDILIEAVLRALHRETYEKAEPFLIVLLPFVPARNIVLGNASLSHIVRWCFESDSKSTDRENVLRILLSNHPKLMPEDVMAKLCEQACFISFIKEIYLPQKSYTKIVSSMIRNEEYRPIVFDFLKEHLEDHEQLKAAIFSNCRPLLLISPQSFVSFLSDNYPEEYDNIIDLLKPSDRLIFLTTLHEINGYLDDEKKMMTFQLLLQFRPRSAEHFLSENIVDMDIDKCQELSVKYNRTDCQVVIKMYLHQYKEATEQIGNEIEKQLLDFIESDSNERPDTIDELADMKDMRRCVEVIDIALKLLTTISIDSNDKMTFQKTYFYFLFPMYLASKSRENIKQSVTLLFSYFIVSSMNCISPHHSFLILSIHFSHLDKDIYKLILKNITARIDYQKYLFKGLDEMLISDCLELIDKVFLQQTRGIKVTELECCVCRGKLDTSQYQKWYLYPCGHICHETCNEKRFEKCPFCSGTSPSERMVIERESRPKKLTPREITRIMRRLQFALKKNFGDDDKSIESPNAAFFSKPPEFDEDLIVEVDDTLPATDDSVIIVQNTD